MVRTQIQLTEELSKKLREISAERQVSMAELIREGMEEFVEKAKSISHEERLKQANAFLGGFRSGRRDIARRHDDYLAEDFR